MHSHFPNHQLYLAEKLNWLDRQVVKNSRRALMKIESYKLIIQLTEDDNQMRLVEKLVKDSLLTNAENQFILKREGFYKSNLSN